MGLGDLSPGAQISIGVCVGILSTSVQSLGLTLQRKSHLLEDEQPLHIKKRPPHRRRRWQIGMLLFIVSNILGSSIQITTLPLVILSPLQASGLVFNSICATLILSEPFTRYSLVGTVLVCVGAGLIAAFGAMEEPAHSLDELLGLLSKRPFLLWMSGTMLLVVGILFAVRASWILRPRARNTARMRMIRGVAYGCVSGILSAHCLLLAKSSVELLVRTIVDRVNQFNRWQSWIILLGLLTLALSQLYYLHRGLKLCSTSVLYPLVFCVYNITAILDGLIYYRQTSRLSALHGGLIGVGTAILLSGVFALSWRLDHETTVPVQSSSALAPGLGFVDTDSEDEGLETGLNPSAPSDSVRSSLLTSNTASTPSTPQPRRFLSPPRHRRRALSEAEEIWGELEDHDDLVSSRRNSGILDEEQAAAANEGTSLIRKIARRRTITGGISTGRRRGSYLFPRTVSMSSGRRQSKPKLQEAIGGWWRMKWWNKEDGDHEGGAAAGASSSSGLSGGTYGTTAARLPRTPGGPSASGVGNGGGETAG